MRRFPSGVAVVTVDANGQRLGLTVSSLMTLSLEPPLVGVAVAREAALHELLRDAGGFAVSLLAQGQEWLAQHFARGVPPIAMWRDVATADGPPGRLCSSAPSAGSSADSLPSTRSVPTRSSSATCSSPRPAPTRRP